MIIFSFILPITIHRRNPFFSVWINFRGLSQRKFSSVLNELVKMKDEGGFGQRNQSTRSKVKKKQRPVTCVSHETPKPAHIGHFFHLSIIRYCPLKRTSPPLKEDICVSVLVPVIVRFYRPFRVLPGISCAPRGEYLKREPTIVIDCFIPDSRPELRCVIAR